MEAFFAYPSSLPDIVQAIHGAKTILLTSHRDLELNLWEENDISGRPLTDPIFEGIGQADFLVADVTAINFNVTFEIGYAIGLGKRVHLTRNSNFKRDQTRRCQSSQRGSKNTIPKRRSNAVVSRRKFMMTIVIPNQECWKPMGAVVSAVVNEQIPSVRN